MVYLGYCTTSVQLHKETSHHSSAIGGKTEAPFPETIESGNTSTVETSWEDFSCFCQKDIMKILALITFSQGFDEVIFSWWSPCNWCIPAVPAAQGIANNILDRTCWDLSKALHKRKTTTFHQSPNWFSLGIPSSEVVCRAESLTNNKSTYSH